MRPENSEHLLNPLYHYARASVVPAIFFRIQRLNQNTGKFTGKGLLSQRLADMFFWVPLMWNEFQIHLESTWLCCSNNGNFAYCETCWLFGDKNNKNEYLIWNLYLSESKCTKYRSSHHRIYTYRSIEEQSNSSSISIPSHPENMFIRLPEFSSRSIPSHEKICIHIFGFNFQNEECII